MDLCSEESEANLEKPLALDVKSSANASKRATKRQRTPRILPARNLFTQSLFLERGAWTSTIISITR